MVDIGYRILRPADFSEKVARLNTGFLSELLRKLFRAAKLSDLRGVVSS